MWPVLSLVDRLLTRLSDEEIGRRAPFTIGLRHESLG
jgi:hypothetical protein